jgi:hypothetical protein
LEFSKLGCGHGPAIPYYPVNGRPAWLEDSFARTSMWAVVAMVMVMMMAMAYYRREGQGGSRDDDEPQT